jgi:hypothetical protein
MLEVKPEAIVPAISGLVGVVLGAALTTAKEWVVASSTRKRQLNYLSVRVVCALDRLVASCAEVVADDGRADGRLNPDGCREFQTKVPAFSPETLDVEWKVLPPALTFAILDLPYQIEMAVQRISDVVEYNGNPPYYEEVFEERQLLFARIGIAADGVAATLRHEARLTARSYEHWNPVEYMREAIKRIESEKRARVSCDIESRAECPR